MSTDFSQLITDIEQEARDDSPQAVRELEQFREEFSLASQLVESRRQNKLSQRELAKLSGVPQSEISRIETGAGNPTHATIAALLRPLGKRIQLVDDGKITKGTGARHSRSGKFTVGSPRKSTARKHAAGKATTKAS